MKFSVSRDALDWQLQYISRVVAIRQSLPVLSNVLLETDGKILRMSGTDMELAVTTYLPAEVEQEGTFTVPAKLFQEFVHQNPDETLHFHLESYELVCTGSKVNGRITGMDADEYPSLPKVEEGKRLTLPALAFVEALKQVVIACALDTSRPVLTGVYLQLNHDVATLAATDSFRLAERAVTILPVQEALTVLLPSRTVQEVIRICAALPAVEDIKVELDDQQALFRIGEVELYSRLITGNFPPYRTIIPKEFVANVQVASAEFVQALRLSYIFSSSGIANVMLEVTEDGTLQLSSYGSQKGNARHTIYSVVEEGFVPLKTAFNAKFLLDAAQATGASHINLHFSGTATALVITTDEPDYTQLVMPIRLDT